MDWLLIKYAKCPDRFVYMQFSCFFFVVVVCVLPHKTHIIAFSAQVMQACACGTRIILTHTKNKRLEVRVATAANLLQK